MAIFSTAILIELGHPCAQTNDQQTVLLVFTYTLKQS